MSPDINRRGIGAFVLFSFGLAWLIALPLWTSRSGLHASWARVDMALMMFTPAIATFIVSRWVSPSHNLGVETGLRLLVPGSRAIRFWIFGWFAFPVLVLGSLLLGVLLGLYPMDLRELSGFRAILESSRGGKIALERFSVHQLAALQLAAGLIGPIFNMPFTFGEEWGWRGYLLPKLLPLGQWRALIIGGVIWGLWHAPVIALGYNYPLHPRLGVLLMICFCVLLSIILGWTRLATGSIWPAVIGHASLNAWAGTPHLFLKKGAQIDAAVVGITGWTGWTLLVLFIAFLVLTQRLPVADPPDSRISPPLASLSRPASRWQH